MKPNVLEWKAKFLLSASANYISYLSANVSTRITPFQGQQKAAILHHHRVSCFMEKLTRVGAVYGVDTMTVISHMLSHSSSTITPFL